MKALIFDVQRSSFVDGPGIRTTVFFKGCNLRCKWCHNPESTAMQRQMMLYKNKCTGCGRCQSVCPCGMNDCTLCGKCADVCPSDARSICGKEWDADELLKVIVQDKDFYDASGGGVTFSGGECMLQVEFLARILKKCKDAGISTAIDTAGAVSYESFLKVMPYTDVFLYDVKAFDEELHKIGTGISNARIIENLRRLSREFKGDIIVRIPVIGGYNEGELPKIAKFLSEIGIKQVELLPYHKMGEHKYDALNMEFTSFTTPDKETMEKYKALFLNS